MKKNKGISLITLIITIIVIIILATIIILNIQSTDIISQAEKAVILNDISSFETELDQYVLKRTLDESGYYDSNKLNASNTIITYNGIEVPDKNIYDIIPSLEDTKYENDVIIDNGEIIYNGIDKDVVQTLPEEKLDIPSPEFVITRLANDSIYRLEENIEFNINITDITEIVNVNLTGKVDILNESGQVIYTDLDDEVVISKVTGTDTNKNVNINILSNILVDEGTYTLKVKSGIAKNELDVLDKEDKEISFYMDTVVPNTPTFSLNDVLPTNQNVIVTIYYPDDAIEKEYSLDGSVTWNEYISPIIMTDNGTIIARAIDIAGNESSVATINITNIDKIAPNITTSSLSIIESTNENIEVIISYPDDAVVEIYSDDNGVTWNNYTVPVIVTQNKTIITKSLDAAGNESEIEIIVISNIDKTAPNSPVINVSTTGVTNQNITVTINYPVDSTLDRYSDDNGATWKTYTAPITVSENTTIKATSKDAAGNESAVVSETISNIDKIAPEAPTFSLSNSAPTNQNVTVTISYQADVVTKQYSINGGSTWNTYSSAVIFTNNGSLVARGKDNAGNYSSTSSISITNIDKTAPVVTFINDTSWKNAITMPGNYVTSYSITDTGGSGGKEQYAIYSTSSAKPSDITNGPFSFTSTTHTIGSEANNSYYLHIKAVDNAGNSAIYTSDVYKVDRLYPDGIFSPSSVTSWTNTDITVNFNPSDIGTSLVYRWRYRVSANGGSSYGSWSSYINGDISKDIVLSVNGQNRIQAEVYDNAGNSVTKTSGLYYIDKIPPSAPTFSLSTTSWVNNNVSVTITYPADVTTKQYSINGGSTWNTYGSAVSISSNGTVVARGKDAAGNYSSVSSINITNIDKTLPSGVFTSTSTNVNNGTITSTFNPSDSGGSGIYRWMYRTSINNGASYSAWSSYIYGDVNKSVTLSAKAAHRIQTYVVDYAGNVNYITSPKYSINYYNDYESYMENYTLTNSMTMVRTTERRHNGSYAVRFDAISSWNNINATAFLATENYYISHGVTRYSFWANSDFKDGDDFKIMTMGNSTNGLNFYIQRETTPYAYVACDQISGTPGGPGKTGITIYDDNWYKFSIFFNGVNSTMEIYNSSNTKLYSKTVDFSGLTYIKDFDIRDSDGGWRVYMDQISVTN